MRMIKDHSLMQLSHEWRMSYFADMFRYNRPQSGRYRQFIQGGWEYIGSDSIYADFEIIQAAMNFMKHLNIECTLEINSIGNKEDRKKYREILKNHFNLSNDQDPLKVLDKMENFDTLVPKMEVNDKDLANFTSLKKLLNANAIDFIENPFLVRGLDYYNALVFEVKPKDSSAQGTLIAGGRYDYFMEQIGGKHLPAVGFGLGVDRIALSINRKFDPDMILVLPLDAPDYGIKVSNDLRSKGEKCLIWQGTDLGKLLKYANKHGFKKAAICGSNEMMKNTVLFKDL
jgi:histidyl-tRNA synthetase